MKGLTRIIAMPATPLINTAALARCGDALGTVKPFQRFPAATEKPLKRLARAQGQLHRAKATVLTRAAFGASERRFGLNRGV